MAEKWLVGMSGGVDSSVAAWLLKDQGCQVLGVTLRLFDNEDAGLERSRTCCSLEDAEDARAVAYRLGMPFYVFNFVEGFRRQVMDRFTAAYQRGETPNPCIDCNRFMKFDRLPQQQSGHAGIHAAAHGHQNPFAHGCCTSASDLF